MDFTNAEKERINQLYGNDFADIKPEDAPLIARWEQMNALREAKFQEQVKAIEAETAAKIEAANERATQAMGNLKELHARALERLERIENGI